MKIISELCAIPNIRFHKAMDSMDIIDTVSQEGGHIVGICDLTRSTCAKSSLSSRGIHAYRARANIRAIFLDSCEVDIQCP